MLVGSRRWAAPVRLAISWPTLLIGVALLIPVVQLVIGVPMGGYHRAHDGSFAIANLVQFRSELLAGNLLPRWSVVGNSGLGSPMFFFYPPGAYYAASLISFVIPGASAATLIGVTQVVFRAGAMLTCFAWLQRRVHTEAALIGSTLYALTPYVALVNPQMRLAFSECAAGVVVPLAFLAVDIGRGRASTIVGLVGAAVCGLALLNLPTTVLTGGLIVVYAALSGSRWGGALRFSVAAAIGVGLGLGLAAFSLLPAIGLLHAIIGSTTLWDPNFRPESHFLLTSNAIRLLHGRLQGLLLDLGLIVPVIMVLTFGRQALRADRLSWALIGTFVIAVLLTTSLSEPVWALLTPLRTAQFPWRLLLPASLLAAAVVATALAACSALLRRCLVAGSLALGAASVAFAALTGDRMSSGSDRTQQALADAAANSVYFIPSEAATHGWLDFAHRSDDYRVRADGLIASCIKRSAGDQGADRLQFDVSGCDRPTILPQFYFPGWAAQTDETSLRVTPDPASGLVSVNLPPGARHLVLRRATLEIEWLGLVVSLLCLCLWIGIVASARWFRQELQLT
jgi:hypothetical protein